MELVDLLFETESTIFYHMFAQQIFLNKYYLSKNFLF